jgi:hypothetical protein
MKKLVSTLIIALTVFATSAAEPKYDFYQEEVILGSIIDIDKITFTVYTTGYTNKESFILDIKQGNKYNEVTLIRIKYDDAKMMENPIEIMFTQDELKNKIKFGKPILIKNKLSFLLFKKYDPNS